MYSLKLNYSDYYLPKTPYTLEEMNNDFITDKPDRIGKWKYKKYVENIKIDLGLSNWEVVESPKY